ncbi:copper-binding metallochaperone CopP [Helicobacter felis]|uniref:copper-binding metallochaperone CopP n=1 Tax=Helicobacter felis TaxID=214 RepID=UPI000EF6991F|nr:copper-binding metallochaperone CopP [Helicobacter felis]
MKIDIPVKGMTCQHCVDKIEKFVGELEGVSYIEVDLDKQSVQVEFSAPASAEAIEEAIEEAGYELG